MQDLFQLGNEFDWHWRGRRTRKAFREIRPPFCLLIGLPSCKAQSKNGGPRLCSKRTMEDGSSYVSGQKKLLGGRWVISN